MSDLTTTASSEGLADSRITVSELRDDLSTTINRVAFGRERIMLLRQGKAVAALVPPEDLELLERIEDVYWTRRAEEVLENYDPADDIPAEQVWERLGAK